MNKNLTRVGFLLAMGLLFFACNNNPALEKDDQDTEQKPSSIQEKINQLQQEIEDELGQYTQIDTFQGFDKFVKEKNQLGSGDQEKLTKKIKQLEFEIKQLRILSQSTTQEESLKAASKSRLELCKPNLEILKKILEKRIQINKLEKELN
mgnify:CR=1 FL=1